MSLSIEGVIVKGHKSGNEEQWLDVGGSHI